ncbi:MAG: hypothetical protein AB1397_06775 [bacterium]
MEQESIEDLRKRYWGEWLLLGEVETDDLQKPTKGILIAHSNRKADIYEKLLETKEEDKIAIEYAGEIPKDYVAMF